MAPAGKRNDLLQKFTDTALLFPYRMEQQAWMSLMMTFILYHQTDLYLSMGNYDCDSS